MMVSTTKARDEPATADREQEALLALLPVRALGPAQRIREGDEAFLVARELELLRKSVLSVQRASGAARSVARELCTALGRPGAELVRGGGGALDEAPGFVRSLAHESAVALAVAAPVKDLAGISVDVEPAAALDPALAPRVASGAERQGFGVDALGVICLPCIKEAVYMAMFPRQGGLLDFLDVTVDRGAGTATPNDSLMRWRVTTQPRVLAVAWH